MNLFDVPSRFFFIKIIFLYYVFYAPDSTFFRPSEFARHRSYYSWKVIAKLLLQKVGFRFNSVYSNCNDVSSRITAIQFSKRDKPVLLKVNI